MWPRASARTVGAVSRRILLYGKLFRIQPGGDLWKNGPKPVVTNALLWQSINLFAIHGSGK